MSQYRASNIELLRIIAITMVLMLHFNARVLYSDVIWNDAAPFSIHALGGHLIESFCIAAVDVFVLISGYFAIKLSVRSVLRMYIRCFIIGLITYLAYILISEEPLHASALAGRLLAFTHNRWWFVPIYVGLMAISPILNAGCDKLERKMFLCVMMLLTMVIVYFGWWMHMEATNAGYSLICFAYLYVVARYIRLHVTLERIISLRWLWFALYIVCSLCIAAGAFKYQEWLYVYDSPMTILSAVSLLLFFLSVPFQNKYINWAASSVFSAYLIQESPYFGKQWLYSVLGDMMANGSLGGGAILFVVFTLVTLMISIIIDKLCVMPVIKWTKKDMRKGCS